MTDPEPEEKTRILATPNEEDEMSGAMDWIMRIVVVVVFLIGTHAVAFVVGYGIRCGL
jgi:flagellar basal body-associated protein FliL